MSNQNNTPSSRMGADIWRYRADDKAMWQYAEGGKPVLSGWIVEPLYDGHTMQEAVAAVREMVRLADMGMEDALKEPEENGSYAAYQRAKRFLAAYPTPAPNVSVEPFAYVKEDRQLTTGYVFKTCAKSDPGAIPVYRSPPATPSAKMEGSADV